MVLKNPIRTIDTARLYPIAAVEVASNERAPLQYIDRGRCHILLCPLDATSNLDSPVEDDAL